jgi:hypothetical protein
MSPAPAPSPVEVDNSTLPTLGTDTDHPIPETQTETTPPVLGSSGIPQRDLRNELLNIDPPTPQPKIRTRIPLPARQRSVRDLRPAYGSPIQLARRFDHWLANRRNVALSPLHQDVLARLIARSQSHWTIEPLEQLELEYQERDRRPPPPSRPELGGVVHNRPIQSDL